MNLDVAGLQEIRLRAEQPAVILSHGKEYVSQTVIHRRQLEETLAYLGNYSLYAYEEEIHLLQHLPKTRGKQFYHLFTPHVVPLLNT